MSMSISSVGSYSFMDRLVSNSMSRNAKTQGTQPDASEMAAQIIKKEDTDGNGSISASETKLQSDVFTKMDTDGDGSLTSSEIQSGMESREMGPTGAQMDPAKMVASMLEKEDANSDGVLSAEESKMDSELFSKIDTDGDGSLTSDELVAGLEEGEGGKQARPAGPPPPMDSSQMASGILESQDTDGDGALSIDESGLDTEEYNVLDTNGDGSVSIEELQAGLEARQTEMENTMATEQSSSGLSVDSLLQVLAQNQASNAYADQSWFTQAQSTSGGLAVSA